MHINSLDTRMKLKFTAKYTHTHTQTHSQPHTDTCYAPNEKQLPKNTFKVDAKRNARPGKQTQGNAKNAEKKHANKQIDEKRMRVENMRA